MVSRGLYEKINSVQKLEKIEERWTSWERETEAKGTAYGTANEKALRQENGWSVHRIARRPVWLEGRE